MNPHSAAGDRFSSSKSELDCHEAPCFDSDMGRGYGQFCPIAKASEIFATRWTPLVLRELMAGVCTFNELHRGIPLMSRALLAERLRQLEHEGIIEKRKPKQGGNDEYWLTPAGDAFRGVLDGLAHWGVTYTRDRLEPVDLDPTLFMWMLRRRTRLTQLPDQRIVMQFDFSGVAPSRTKHKRMWLVLERPEIDVCMKDPGHDIDILVLGDIAVFVALLLGHARWSDKNGQAITTEGQSKLVEQIPMWFNL
jgi:DNA-binding HxlR family transcriptional regulator